MLNYLCAEWYKLTHRKYTLIFPLIILACEILLVSGWIFSNSHDNTIDFYTGGSMAVSFLSMGLYLLAAIADIVFSSQYKYSTLKNEVSFGIPRTRIFLGKYLTATALGILLAAFFLIFYEALCRFTLLPSSPEQAILTLTIVGWCALAALPQFLGMLAVCFLLFFLIRGEIASTAAYLGVLIIPQSVFELIYIFSRDPVWEILLSLMPQYLVDYASRVVGDWGYMGICWATGAAWTAISLLLGMFLFRKKEIS